jgi:hypothetical protein
MDAMKGGASVEFGIESNGSAVKIGLRNIGELCYVSLWE